MIGKTLKKIAELIKQERDPVGYARSIGVTVGERCIIESFNFGSEPFLIFIGDHVEITTDVTFITHDGATWVMRENPQFKDVIRFGKIVINDNVFIGHGVTILPNVEIGCNVIIGAGSVVTSDIPSNCVFAGVPARFICNTNDYAKKCLAETPNWDKKQFKKDKKSELLRILEIE